MMYLRGILIITLLLIGSSLARKHQKESNWKEVYENISKYLPDNFALDQLSYFAGWRQHQGGTYENSLLADKLLQDWQQWGWPIVKMVNFTVRLPRGPPEGGPFNEVVILHRNTMEEQQRAKNNVTFKCTDLQIHGNETCSSSTTFTAPVYCGFARAGNATGRPVFVNYGRKSDYVTFKNADELCSPDIILLARHGYTSYGSKVRQVVSHCVNLGSSKLPGGMIIYRDPTDSAPDVKVYPEGIGLPSDGIAFRVSTMNKESGDSETPGFPAVDGVYKIESAEKKAVTPFPVQTIDFDDAQVIINGMGGKPVPKEWQPCTVKSMGPEGDNLIRLELRNRIEEEPSPVVNVIGVMPGKGPEADKYVIFGNHRDAWVQGASDPHSGTVVLQGIAYLLGMAYQEGWRPKRSIVIASWDAEEVNLVGSTEFTELYQNELLSKAVVYLNQDCPVKGNATFIPRTDEFLEKALLDSANEIHGPCNASLSFLEEWRERQIGKENRKPRTMPVGGFSDHVPFQYQLGIPSTYPEFKPAPPLFEAPSYHTAYDSVDMAVRFTDPPCSSSGPLLPLHHLLIRYHFILMLKFSSSSRLPIYPVPKATTLKQSWDDIVAYADQNIVDIMTRFGINLNYVSDKIEEFLNASKTFESFIGMVESGNPKCYPIYNDVLSRLPKQFILNANVATPRHVLVDGSSCLTHHDSYFPRIRILLQHLSQNSDIDSKILVKALKFELSALTTAFTAASNLLRGGLFGSINALNAHLCPHFDHQ